MQWELKKYPMYIAGVKQAYPYIEQGMPFLSKSAIVGNLIYLSGLTSIDMKTGHLSSLHLEDQVVGCLENIKAALEESGSSIENLVKHTIFVRDIEDCPCIWKTMVDYYRNHAPNLIMEPPAATVIPVTSFLKPECRLEMDSIAILVKNAPGWKVRKYPLRYLSTPHTYLPVGQSLPLLSESVAVGNLLLLSSMGGQNPKTGKIEIKDFELQMDIGFDKVRNALDRAGSAVSNIVKTLHLLTGVDSLLEASSDTGVSHSPASDRLWKRELEHYEMYAPVLLDDFPGSTFLKLPLFEGPDSMVEIEVIGVLSPNEPGWEVKKYPLYYGKRGFPRHIGEIKKYYANTVVVGGLILISGQTATNHSTGRIEAATFEGQVQVALDNLRDAIEETGSSLDNLVKTYILMPDKTHYSTMRKLELEYYQKYAPKLVAEPPASTFIQPLNLASPNMMIEIDAIGFLPNANSIK